MLFGKLSRINFQYRLHYYDKKWLHHLLRRLTHLCDALLKLIVSHYYRFLAGFWGLLAINIARFGAG